MKPKANAKGSISVLGQLCKEIAPHLVAKVVRQEEARLGERCFFRLPKRFKRAVRAIDSTSTELIASCMDRARYRKRKAAAKMHPSLDTASFLPVRIIVEPAKGHDANYMVELCAGMKAGETAVFDNAYVAYSHLDTLTERGICWVTRAKDNARFRAVRNLALLISCYGTAKRLPRADLCPSMPYLPGFEGLQFG